MKDRPSERRVVMAKTLATRWLTARLRPEYRLKVYLGAYQIRGLPALLRSFRNGTLKIGSVDPIPDLGILEDFDHFMVWSSDKEGLQALQKWFEKRGCETTGIW